MSFDPGIKPGTIINNKQLCDIFKCSPQGGMRRSHKTNTLVIVSDKTKPFYVDEWKGDILHYTGMGQTGDQSIDFMQNKTLNQSNRNGVQVHLLEVYSPQEYTYIGQVELVDEPYQNPQRDHLGNIRTVWLFPVKVIDENIQPISIEQYTKSEEIREKTLKRKSTRELLESVRENRTPGSRAVTSNQYERDLTVSVLAKRRARGVCQLCGEKAPFMKPDGEPYLETHHIEWLSRGGPDTLDNTVALCPNCHRKMHILDLPGDITYLSNIVRETISIE